MVLHTFLELHKAVLIYFANIKMSNIDSVFIGVPSNNLSLFLSLFLSLSLAKTQILYLFSDESKKPNLLLILIIIEKAISYLVQPNIPIEGDHHSWRDPYAKNTVAGEFCHR